MIEPRSELVTQDCLEVARIFPPPRPNPSRAPWPAHASQSVVWVLSRGKPVSARGASDQVEEAVIVHDPFLPP